MTLDLPLIAGWCIELALLVLALLIISRLVGGRIILVLTLSSFGLRLMVGETLYVVSALQLPILRQLQIPGGFWHFGYDAAVYDSQAHTIFDLEGHSRFGALYGALVTSSDSIGAGLGLPHGVISVQPFARLLTILYAGFGFNPSQGLVFVAAAAAACVPLAYLTARSVGLPQRTSLVCAALVALWPSSYLWSGQILKDSLDWFAIFAIAAGSTALLRASTQPSVRGLLAPALLVVIGGFLNATIRDYATAVWLIALLLGLLAFVLQRTARSWSKTFLLAGVILGALLVGNGATRLAGLAAYLPASETTRSVTQVAQLAASVGANAFDATEPGEDTSSATDSMGRTVEPNTILWNGPTGPVTLASMRRYLRANAYLDQLQGTHWDDLDDLGQRYANLLNHPLTVVYPGVSAHTPAENTAPPSPDKTEPEELRIDCSPARSLLIKRAGFAHTTAASQMDSEVPLTTCVQVIRYLPRAFELALLAPLPSDWNRAGSDVGEMRYLAPADLLLLWLLLPGLIAGLLRIVVQPTPSRIVIGTYVLLLGLALGLVVTILGTLFRLRLQVVLPGAIVAADGWLWLFQMYRTHASFRVRELTVRLKRA